jgi:hypothetical protein
MPDETTFELASIQFGAEPVAVFRFGYERFELRARLGPGNLEHAIAAAQRSQPASLRDGRTRRWPLRSGFALATLRPSTISAALPHTFRNIDCSPQTVVAGDSRDPCSHSRLMSGHFVRTLEPMMARPRLARSALAHDSRRWRKWF